MRKTSVYSYFSFGFNYYLLLRVGREETFVLHEDDDNNSLEKSIIDFFSKIDSLNLSVTTIASYEVRSILKDIQARRAQFKGKKVDEALATKVKSAFEKLDVTLDSELLFLTCAN